MKVDQLAQLAGKALRVLQVLNSEAHDEATLSSHAGPMPLPVVADLACTGAYRNASRALSTCAWNGGI